MWKKAIGLGVLLLGLLADAAIGYPSVLDTGDFAELSPGCQEKIWQMRQDIDDNLPRSCRGLNRVFVVQDSKGQFLVTFYNPCQRFAPRRMGNGRVAPEIFVAQALRRFCPEVKIYAFTKDIRQYLPLRWTSYRTGFRILQDSRRIEKPGDFYFIRHPDAVDWDYDPNLVDFQFHEKPLRGFLQCSTDTPIFVWLKDFRPAKIFPEGNAGIAYFPARGKFLGLPVVGLQKGICDTKWSSPNPYGCGWASAMGIIINRPFNEVRAYLRRQMGIDFTQEKRSRIAETPERPLLKPLDRNQSLLFCDSGGL